MVNSNETTSTTMNKKEDNAAALSWWRESHNRPHHSQWLQATLSDLDEKTQLMLDIIQQDGDTFAKRAEMFYAKKPELITRLEDFYKSYRSIAENYDQLRSDIVQVTSLSLLDNIKLQTVKKCEKEISHYLKHKALPNPCTLDTKTTRTSESDDNNATSDECMPRKRDDSLDSKSNCDEAEEALRDLENLKVKLLEGRISKLEDEKKLVWEIGHRNGTIKMLMEENRMLKDELKWNEALREAELKEKELLRLKGMIRSSFMGRMTGYMSGNEVERSKTKTKKKKKKKPSFLSRFITGCIGYDSSNDSGSI